MNTKRVLVIDDEPDIRETIQLSLNILTDWDVLTAASGVEGLMIAQTEQPDAILLDILMPEMDGLTTFQQMQTNPVLQDIPVIFITATAYLTERQLIKLRASGVIKKPFSPTNLVEKMRSFLNWEN